MGYIIDEEQNGSGVESKVCTAANDLTAKATPIGADLVVNADSADSNNPKKVTLSSLPPTTNEKAGVVAGGSFSGNPKKFTVTFNTAMPDNNYAISITAEDIKDWIIESKAAAGFTINSSSNSAFSGNVFWIARVNNDP